MGMESCPLSPKGVPPVLGLRVKNAQNFKTDCRYPFKGTGAIIHGYQSKVTARTISFIFLWIKKKTNNQASPGLSSAAKQKVINFNVQTNQGLDAMVLSIAVGFSQRIDGLRIGRRSEFQTGLSIPLQGTGATIDGYQS